MLIMKIIKSIQKEHEPVQLKIWDFLKTSVSEVAGDVQKDVKEMKNDIVA